VWTRGVLLGNKEPLSSETLTARGEKRPTKRRDQQSLHEKEGDLNRNHVRKMAGGFSWGRGENLGVLGQGPRVFCKQLCLKGVKEKKAKGGAKKGDTGNFPEETRSGGGTFFEEQV